MKRLIPMTSLLALCLTLGVWTSACSRNKQEAQTTTEKTYPQVQVSRVDLGRGVGPDKMVTEPTAEFRPNETVYATVITTAAPPNTNITARWTYQDGQVVEETTQLVAPGTEAASEFHISKPDGWPAGKYKLEVLVNGNPAATKEFEVKAS
jgi:hypothetical protein